MGSPKEFLPGALVGFWAWLLYGIAMGAALPVPTEYPDIEDDYSTPKFLSTEIYADFVGPTFPTATEEAPYFLVETTFPPETNGEIPEAVGEGETANPGEPPNFGLASSKDDFASPASTPQTFKIPEDLKETSADKSALSQVNSSEPTLGRETLRGDTLAESQEATKETPDLETGYEATEPITGRSSSITDPSVTSLKEDFLTSPSEDEAQAEISSQNPPEGDEQLDNTPGEPNLDEELKPNPTLWVETEATVGETPEPSMDESGTLEDPSSNPTVFPSAPEDLPLQGTGENVDSGDLPSLSSEGHPETSQSSTGSPPIQPLLTHENFGSPGTNDSLQPSPASVDSGSPEGGRGDADPIPPSSGPELNQESLVNLPSEEPEDLVDAEASDSSPSGRTVDAPSGSGPPTQLDASVTPEIPSRLPGDGEVGITSTAEEEGLEGKEGEEQEGEGGEQEGEEEGGGGQEDTGSPKIDVEEELPLPGEEPAQATEIPDEERSADVLSGTASSLNPGVETTDSELEDSEATTTASNVVPEEDAINPISSDSGTVPENESGALVDTVGSSPPSADNEGPGEAQEPPVETQGSPTEASVPASTDDGPSTEANEISPSGSPGNTSTSLGELDAEANGKDGSGSDLSPPDTELSLISGTPLPVGRSGTDDQLSPSQSLVENALTSGSGSFSEVEDTFPSTSPDEALSGPLISEPDATELPSNSLPGSQPSSQLPKENDVETGSGDVEDSLAVDHQGATEVQGPPTEASAPGSSYEPSSEGEGSEVSPTRSPGVIASGNSDTNPRVSSDEVDTQANGEDHSVSDFPPSDTELSSISGTPMATSPQPSKEDDAETQSVDPEDSLNGEETSSAPSIINPPSVLAEATEEPSIPGDASDGSIVSPKEERFGSTSEPGVHEEPLLDGDDTQDKSNIPLSEQQLGSEDALETSIPSSGAVKSGTISPLVDTDTSTKTQEPSEETSSVTIEDRLSNSESEDGELSPNLSSKTLDSSPGIEIVDENRDEEDDAGSASNDGQPGSDFSVGQFVTSPIGGILALAPMEDGETSVPRDDAELSTGPVSSEDGALLSGSSDERTETSASEPSAVGSQPSPDNEVAPEMSKETEQLQTSEASEIVSPLASSTTEDTISETSSQGPLDRESKTSTSEEDTEGSSDGQFSLNNNGAETTTVESENNGGSQLLSELEITGLGSTNNAEAQPLEASDISNRVEPLESSSSVHEGESLLDSSVPESSTVLEDQEVSGKPRDGDGSVNSEPATDAEPQSSPNGGDVPGGATVSEEAGTPEVSGTSEESSAAPESQQATSSSNEEETSNTTTNAGSQLPLDGKSDGAEISGASSIVPGEEGSLSPSTSESLGDSSSTQEVGTASRKSTTDEGSQLSTDGTSPEDSLASEGAESAESQPIASGDKATLVPSATELQFPETPANENVLGGLENGESSLSQGGETAKAESSKNEGSQTSPDSVATEGEEAETSEGNSIASEKQSSLTPSSTEPQSPGTPPASQDVSENLVNGEPSLSSDGGKDTANVETADAQSATSSAGTGPDQNNIAEQLGQNSDSISGPSSGDGALVSKSSGETSIPSSVSSDGDLANQETSQERLGAPDSSQPSLDIQGNLANFINALSPGDHISIGDTLGVSDGPNLVAKAGGEVLQEVSEALAGVNNFIHPSPAEETKPIADQLFRGVSPLVFLSPQNGLLLAPSNLGAPKLGNVVGNSPSPSTPEERSEVVDSILAVHKGLSVASSTDGAQPSLLGAKGGPTKISKLVPGKPGLQDKADTPLLSSKPVSASGKPGLQGKADAPQLSPKPEVPGKLVSGKPGLQDKADSLLLSSKPEVPGKLVSGKPGLQDKVDSLLLSSKPEVPGKLVSGKPGLQDKTDSLLLSSKPEVPGKLVSGKPGLQDKADSLLLSSKPEVPGKLVSGKPGLQGKADSLLLSSKPEVPAKTSKLVSGKPGLQGKADTQLSSKPEVPAKLSKLTSGKPGLQTKAGTSLPSFNADVLANSDRTLPEKLDSASSRSSSASDENDSSSDSNSLEDHQTLMKDGQGLGIYRVDNKIRLIYRQRCLNWLSHERLPLAWNKNLPTCPCSLQQGRSDHRYITAQRGWQESGSTLLFSSRPNPYGAGVRCVYNRNGQLQEGRQERIWKKYRKNYPNNDEELKLHDWCCNKAGNPQMCEKYDQKRPRIGCQGYKPLIYG
ncbi:serine-rich adhesin for platelets-like isoform X2 [Erythrolamprus reginae]|uniref:serine-rich adhesin for platelets-like isoform X2 n=1 Tax=Erythrolamprus reginae TaxID=121349 RepID=UPI00396CF4F4